MSTPTTPVVHHPINNDNTSSFTQRNAASLQRSFTLPAKLTDAPNATRQTSGSGVEIGASEAIETLYVHPGARIISFTTAASANALTRPGSSASVNRRSSSTFESYSGGSDGDWGNGLAWENATERTLAAGPLEIYRVPGSVSFLHSGALLHAILPRSQCWCVDGVSKFVFRIRPDTYYRIELPSTNPGEEELVEGLKLTLSKVLYYERTACPFRRGFGDALPEMPEVPRRSLSRSASVGRAKKWTFERRWRPEGERGNLEALSQLSSIRDEGRYAVQHAQGHQYSRLEEEKEDEEESQAGAEAEERPATVDSHTPSPSPLHSRTARSVTAPPQLSSKLSRAPSKTTVPKIAGRINEAVRQQSGSTLIPRPIKRRQHSDASTPKLPPTPESLQDEFTSPFLVTEEESAREGDGDHVEATGVPTLISESEDSLLLNSPSTPRPIATSVPAPEPSLDSSSNSASFSCVDSWPANGKNNSTISLSQSSSYHSLPPTRQPSPAPTASASGTAPSTETPPDQHLVRRTHHTRTVTPTTLLLPAATASSATKQALRSLTPTTPSSSTVTTLSSTTTALVKKTATIFLGPPAHLVHIMLRIAARILLSALEHGTDDDEHGHDGRRHGRDEFYEAITVPLHGADDNELLHREITPSKSSTLPLIDGKQEISPASAYASLGFSPLPLKSFSPSSSSSFSSSSASTSSTTTTTTTTTTTRATRTSVLQTETEMQKRRGHRRVVPGSFDFSDDEEEWGM
ncbi:hypothetical protein AAFC00_001079 [Neodothiora populina]|uniref:Inheritance of peroxisomes protein 1 n=1 Tax=Neodothiora populina TaxID=2781224 RepID=A0ABR3PMS4_9PEZI